MALIYIQGEEEKRQHIHYEVNPSLPSLGEGGMGQVLRGVRVNEQNGLRQDVAIKFLFEDLPAHAIERARREASIQIHNENLVEMFGFIEIVENPQAAEPTRRYHVVSELLEGVMLFDLLNGKTTDKYGTEIEYAQELYNKYLNDKFGFAVLMVKNVLSGLMALHDKGYIHRDLDPSNIMITRDRKIKIIDFGIAKQLNSLNTQDQQLTSTGQFIGKAAYAAPELVLGDIHSQDKTTDIYAVGIMLYQFIVGSLPFEGTIAELIEQQLHQKMPLKNVPYKKIRNIIAKATAKKQSERYQSAAEMRVDMEHLSKADAVPSKTVVDGISMRLSDIGGKKKHIGLIAAAAAAAAAVVAIIAAIALFTGGGPTPEELAQARKDSLFQARNGQVVDQIGSAEVTDPESGAKMKPIGALVDEALKNIADPAHVNEGVTQLRNIADTYGSYKNAAKAMAMLAAITQPEDASISPEQVKQIRQMTETIVNRSAAKAHQYAERAVGANPECYQAVFELATDYVAGEARTGNPNVQDTKKSLSLFTDGLKYATESGDKEYIELYTTRINQVTSLVQNDNEETE